MTISSRLTGTALALTVAAIPFSSARTETTVFHGSQSVETVKTAVVPKARNTPPAIVLRGGDGAELHVLPGHPSPEVTRIRRHIRQRSP